MKAKLVIRGLRVSFQEGRYVWMDKQKSKEELRPSRMLHRAFTSYKDVANEPNIKKNQMLKTLE
eukprot:3424276-Karenia_brevis.AAC.1